MPGFVDEVAGKGFAENPDGAMIAPGWTFRPWHRSLSADTHSECSRLVVQCPRTDTEQSSAGVDDVEAEARRGG